MSKYLIKTAGTLAGLTALTWTMASMTQALVVLFVAAAGITSMVEATLRKVGM